MHERIKVLQELKKQKPIKMTGFSSTMDTPILCNIMM